ncbi:MAG: DUF4230 domain-containing protein [Candidatus Sumerlaeaceae bacterium]
MDQQTLRVRARNPFLLRIARQLSILLILLLAGYGIYKLINPIPRTAEPGSLRRTETIVNTLPPISRSEIVSQFKLVTVERQYRIPVIGTTYKPMPNPQRDGAMGRVSQALFGKRERVPGTTQNLVYEMVTTVTAGIDLSSLQDSDIVNGERETTITLPAVEVLSVSHDSTKSKIFSQESPNMPYVGNAATLLTDMQKRGEIRHWEEARKDDALLYRARVTAEQDLQKLLGPTHPGRQIHFVFRTRATP